MITMRGLILESNWLGRHLYNLCWAAGLWQKKMLYRHFMKVVFLPVPGEVETSSDGGQSVKYIPTDQMIKGLLKAICLIIISGFNIPFPKYNYPTARSNWDFLI
jgi:hypothetical protein